MASDDGGEIDTTQREHGGMDAARTAARQIDSALRGAGKPERATNEKRYLKSELEHYGTSVPATAKVVRAFLTRHPDIDRQQLIALVRALWEVPVHERRMAAAELLCRGADQLEPGDLELLERLLRESRTWALVDPLAIEVVGPLVRRHPQTREILARWSRDEEFWLRRTVLLSYLLPLRNGDAAEFGGFGGYADEMLEEREFFIRKAIGWVLREYSKRRPDEVFAWLLPRAPRAAGLTLREGSRYLSEEQRRKLEEARSK